MSSNANLPPIRAYIWNRFLFNDNSNYSGKTGGHFVSVRARQNQALQFTVLLDNGVLFTGLPAHAITFVENEYDNSLNLQDCQMWDCISDDIEVFCMETIRYAECEVVPDKIQSKSGIYLFTIDFVGEGFSRHPTHWKQLHAIKTNDGNFLLYPQYRVIFLDKALFEDSKLPKYVANTKHWIVGS
ncbi:hypothetical protein EBU94_03180 [bacterium]|nr:hypothetical protein [bacterium]